MNRKIETADIDKAKHYAPVNFIDDDLLITDEVKMSPIKDVALQADSIFIVLCTEGQLHLTINTTDHHIIRNEIIVISEKNVVEHYTTTPDAKGICLILSSSFLHETIRDGSDISALFRFTRQNTTITLTDQQRDTFKEYGELLRKKIAQMDNTFRREIARSLLLTMFYELSNIIQYADAGKEKHSKRADELFNNFINLVEKNYQTKRSVTWYADQMCVTPKYLSEMVKKASNRIPREWIDQYVTLHIRIQLRNTNKSIKEIAAEMEYYDISAFGRYFKAHVGVSPRQYRKQ